MPVNNFLYLTDARSAQNAFLYAPTPRANANNFLYTCYGTNGPVAMSDPDAAAYATTAQVLATPERNALNTLVVQLKAAGLWVKMTAVYPMTPSAGPLVDSYKLNLKNVATHELVIPVDVNCGLDGIRNTLNTTNVCTSSTLNYSVVNTENNAIGVYHKTVAPPVSDVDISIAGGGVQNFLTTRSPGAVGGLPGESGYLHYSSGVGANILNGLAGSPGLHVLNRSAGTSIYYVRSSAIETKVGTTITQPVGGVFTLGSRSAARVSFAFVSTALTGVEISTLNTIVDAYQAALTVPRDFKPSQLLDTNANDFYAITQLPRWRHIEIINDLVTGLKAASLWLLIDLLYPFIGGNAYRHSINLKNPLANTITWNAATHSVAGVTLGNLGNSTGFVLRNNSPYYGTYIVGGAGVDGADFFTNVLPRENFYTNFGGTTYSDLGNVSDGRLTTSIQASTVRYAATTRVGGTSHIFVNSSSVASGSTLTSDVSGQPVQLSVGGGDTANGRQTALCVVADSLTPAQHSTLYSLIQAYQTAMARQV
jgi:hypothetical protein